MNSVEQTRMALPTRRPILLAAGAALLLAVVALSHAGPAHSVLLLAAATLVSEDLTCIAAGQLVYRDEMSAGVAVIGCILGIFIGDLGLWLAGRLLKPVIARRFEWEGRSAPHLILLARFIPGMRLPVYLSLGATGVDFIRFSFWAMIGAVIWTPLLVLLVAHLGDTIATPIEHYLGSGWLSLLAAVVAGMVVIRLAAMALTEIGRARLIAKISKIWRWEFWPGWLFYLPLLPYLAWLSIRHRGFLTITAANPGIPHGGFVGESKFQILSTLDSPHVSPTAIIREGPIDSRIGRFERILHERSWSLPVIFKPDAGQRGAGVKLVRSIEEARAYLESDSSSILIQPYHPGPFEAGIFYYRIPGKTRGKILSITDKRFASLIGDGKSTIEQLIWKHPRLRMQAAVFLARHAERAPRVLARGEAFALGMAGNHCQGTLFCDGAHLLTPQLEAAIDSVAQTFHGFYFGRFDVRYTDVERFKAGEDFTIIELNGITSESTNLYDPSWSLHRAYRQLFQQWAILFQIGHLNRQRGVAASSMFDLIRDTAGFYRGRQTALLAD